MSQSEEDSSMKMSPLGMGRALVPPRRRDHLIYEFGNENICTVINSDTLELVAESLSISLKFYLSALI